MSTSVFPFAAINNVTRVLIGTKHRPAVLVGMGDIRKN